MSGSGPVVIVALAVVLTTAGAAAAAAAADHRLARRGADDGGFGLQAAEAAAAAASQSESEWFEMLDRDTVGDNNIESSDFAVGEGSVGGSGGEAWEERGGNAQWQPSARKNSSPIESAAAFSSKCECGSAIAAAKAAAARMAYGPAAVTAGVATLTENGASDGEIPKAAAVREPMDVVLSRYRTWIKQGGPAIIAFAKKFTNLPMPSVGATTAAVATAMAAADTIKTAEYTARSELSVVATTKMETSTAETAEASATAAMSAAATTPAAVIQAASSAPSLAIVASAASCPPGFYTLRDWNHCYLLSTFKTTRALASEYCYSMGAGVELLTIDSTKEHHLVAYLIQQSGAAQDADGWWTAGVSVPYSGWAWRLRVRFAEMRFFMWSPAAAGGSGGGQSDRGKCLILQKSSGYFWSSDRCSDDTTVLSGVARHNFVCKAPLTTPKPCS